MTYNELAFDILELLKSSQISDDTDISLEHILYHANIQRALFLRNEFNKPGRTISPQLVQDLGCLKLEEVDAADCCNLPTGCIALRTVEKMPKFLDMHNGPAVKKVGPINKMVGTNWYTTQNKAVLGVHGKYTSKEIHAFLLNEYMYVIINNPASQNLEYINVRGIIEDPMELQRFKCDDGTSCFSYDDQYPVGAWMLAYMKEQILQQFGVSLQLPKDNDNNAKDNLSPS